MIRQSIRSIGSRTRGSRSWQASGAVALLAATLLVPAFQGSAEAVGTISFTSIAATYGVPLDETVTYTSSLAEPVTFTFESQTVNGMTLDTTTVLRLLDTPTAVELTTFTITAWSGSDSATGILEVSVCPQRLLNVTTSSADRCLAAKTSAALPATGIAPGESETASTPTGVDPHAYFNNASESTACAACHRMHADKSQRFQADPQANHADQCLSCHDGTGASSKVHLAYSAAPANDTATRTTYSHDASMLASGHQVATVDDEGGSSVANEFEAKSSRHSDCVDCHNPHGSQLAIARQLTDTNTGNGAGWSVSGAIQGASVADVSDSSAPLFVSGAVRVPKPGDVQTKVNFEYQLCMKCHSSFTSLPSNIPFSETSSAWYLDKAAMIDTSVANASFHPVSRPGTNQSIAMRQSLRGPSAFKLWYFSETDTVRCTNCHADGASEQQGPGQSLGVHASSNPGILLAAYQDRALVPASDTASTSLQRITRFALCFVCHTDVPFTGSTTMSGTNFRYHYEHIQAIADKGSGGSGTIDTSGAGNGNAVCSECHFRLHSTADASGVGAMRGARLVNFAPNVEQTALGQITWTVRTGGTAGTCTLKCHGVTHNGTAY